MKERSNISILGQSCLIRQVSSVYYFSRSLRRSTEPFGGIQLIVCGDFLQLPPVTKGKDKANFCFQVLHSFRHSSCFFHFSLDLTWH